MMLLLLLPRYSNRFPPQLTGRCNPFGEIFGYTSESSCGRDNTNSFETSLANADTSHEIEVMVVVLIASVPFCCQIPHLNTRSVLRTGPWTLSPTTPTAGTATLARFRLLTVNHSHQGFGMG